jgi:hypothetical protein
MCPWRHALLAVGTAVAFVVTSRDAHACTGPLSRLCRGTKVLAAPTDPPWLVFTNPPESIGPNFTLVPSTKTPQVTLTDMGGAIVDVTVSADPQLNGSYVLTPATTLAAGATYVVKWEPACEPASFPDPTQTEVTIPSIPATPTVLGELLASPPVQRVFGRTSCDAVGTEGDEVIAEVALLHDPSFYPWSDLAKIEVLVDGSPLVNDVRWSARAVGGDGRYLRAFCDPASSSGITPAPHTVSFRATLPGGMEPLFSREMTIDFSCRLPVTVGGSTSSDSNGAPPDPVNEAPASVSNGSDCAISLRSRRTSASGGFLLLAFSLGIIRRRMNNGARER